MADTEVNAYVQQRISEAQTKGFTCIEAEENILRRMLREQGVAEEMAMELLPEDFSNHEYAQVFRAMQGLVSARKQVDLVSVDAELTKLYGADWTPVTLANIAKKRDYTIEAWQNVRNLTQIVRDLSRRRQAIASLENLMAGLYDPTKDVGGTLAEIAEAADKIDSGDADWVDMSNVLLETYTYIDKRQRGEIKAITTGIGGLDRLMGGFFSEELTIIAARPSVGKSAFGANVALAAAQQGFKVGIVSCEMNNVGLGQRLLSHGAWVDGMRIRKADLDTEAWDKLAGAMADMSELPISFLFDCLSVEDVVKTVRKKARRGELDILIIDYLQFMETRRKFDSDHLRVGYISHELKRLARKAKIPVVCLAQVNRNAEGRMPTKNDLKDSGTIEQDADGILFIHRPESSDDPTIDPRDKANWRQLKDSGLTYLSIGIAKQRNGAIGQTNIIFDASMMRYSEIARED